VQFNRQIEISTIVAQAQAVALKEQAYYILCSGGASMDLPTSYAPAIYV
jgi:hypothetical protein